MHQIVACSLYKLLKATHMDYSKETDKQPGDVPSFEAWCEHRKLQSPRFHFWYMVLFLIRSFGEANFFLYCQPLAELTSYFFAKAI